MTNKDYGYSEIDWENTNPKIVKEVRLQYSSRLKNSIIDFKDVDDKARYWFTGLLGMVTALVAYASTNNVENLPIVIMVLGYSAALMLFAWSLYPRRMFGTGFTPLGMDMSNWKEHLEGGKGELRDLHGGILRNQAKNIVANEDTVAKKSNYLKYGFIVALLSTVVSGAAWLVTIFCTC